MNAEPVHFPPFRLHPGDQRLYRGQAAVPLRPKTYAVLRHLVGRAGQLVTKEDLFDAVWPETAVSDGVLKVSIRELREALGDDPKSPRFIETAHRAGYRFIAEVAASTVPVYLTRFVGREGASSDLERLLRVTRLVTLTGAGGSGKTRLAARVADRMAGAFPDGVAWVDLAALADPRLVAQGAASVLGVHEQPGRTLTDTIGSCLRSKEMLLVLDNCEHLVEACAELADALLRTCPRLRVLATSREPLGVAGETYWPVPPLSLPSPDGSSHLEQLESSEALRLFVDRAQAAVPGFAPRERDAGALAEVCRRLDGLPLAIELAAPRLKVVSVDELAARLERGFRLLTSSGRTVLPRHQTLRATIDWSYALLPEPERALLLQLSVFAGGWSLAAADRVCADLGLEAGEVFDLISRLVDKSLVMVRNQAGDTRYGLLETVRQYAQEKLDEEGRGRAVRRRHAAYYATLAEELAPEINTTRRRAILGRLEADHDNLRDALRFAAQDGDTALELRLCHALVFFWFHRGYWSEGRRWLQGALERSAPDGRSRARGRVLADEGTLACFMGDQAAALDGLNASIAIHREAGERLDLAYALRLLTFPLAGSDPDRGRAAAEEAVTIYRHEGGSPFDLALALSQLGSAAYAQQDWEAARAAFGEAAGICRTIGDSWLLAAPLTKLGLVALRQGDFDTAIARLKDAIASQRDIGEKWFLALGVEGLANVLAARGDHERAGRLFGAAEGLREAVGAAVLPFYLRDQDRAIAALRAAVGEPTLAAWWSEGRAMTIEQAGAYALADEAPGPGHPRPSSG